MKHNPPPKCGNTNPNILSRASTLMLWFQFGSGLERKISPLVCPVHFQERSIKCFCCFKRGQERLCLQSTPAGINRKKTAQKQRLCSEQESVMPFFVLRRCESSSRHSKESSKNNRLTLKGEMTRISQCCIVAFCLLRTSRRRKLEGNGLLDVSLLDC